jgi:hypothetical protein
VIPGELIVIAAKDDAQANRFQGVAKGETGVPWCRFPNQEGNSG